MKEQATAQVPVRIKDNVEFLRHLAYLLAEMAKIQCGWIPGTAWWELKLYLARCQWEDASRAEELYNRLKEFRVGRTEGSPNQQLDKLLEALADAPDGEAFNSGLFQVIKPYLTAQCHNHLETIDPLVDQPTMMILQGFIMQEERQIDTAGAQMQEWYKNAEDNAETGAWNAYLQSLLVELGDLPASEEADLPSLRQHAPLRPSPIGLRDSRFTTSFQLEPPLEGIEDEASKYEIRVVMTYFKEMQAVETVASSLFETKGMPWAFYYETSRHCWDEARHCMLGERRFEQLGLNTKSIRSMNGNYAVRQLLDPLYRYTYITMVEEAGSMKSKRKWVEDLESYGKTLTARLVEYDLADERNHVNNGFRWIPEMLKARGDSRSLEEVVAEAKRLRKQAFELVKLAEEGI